MDFLLSLGIAFGLGVPFSIIWYFIIIKYMEYADNKSECHDFFDELLTFYEKDIKAYKCIKVMDDFCSITHPIFIVLYISLGVMGTYFMVFIIEGFFNVILAVINHSSASTLQMSEKFNFYRLLGSYLLVIIRNKYIKSFRKSISFISHYIEVKK